MSNKDMKKLFNFGSQNEQSVGVGGVQTKRYSLNDLVASQEDQEKILRKHELNSEFVPKADFFLFKNHVFFDNALEKSQKAVSNILNDFPYDGTRNDYDQWYISSSYFEKSLYDIQYGISASFGYPKFVGAYHINKQIETNEDFRIVYNDSGSIYYNQLGNLTSSFTIEFWLKTTQDYGWYPIFYERYFDGIAPDDVWNYNKPIIILHNLSASNVAGYPFWGYCFNIVHIEADNARPYIRFEIHSGSTSITLSSSIDNWVAKSGSWAHVAGVFDRENFKTLLYLSGNLVKSASIPDSFGYINTNNAGLYIFSTASNANFYGKYLNYTPLYSASFFTGAIDELRVWHKARTQEEIQKNMNSELYAQNSLMLYSKFNETTGSFAIDYSGHDLHGIIKNFDPKCKQTNLANFSTHMLYERKEPVLHESNQEYIFFTSSLYFSASEYDLTNESQITTLVPSYLIEKDIEDYNAGVFHPFLYSFARSIDEIKLFIDQFANLYNFSYDNTNTIFDEACLYAVKALGWNVGAGTGGGYYDDKDILQFLFGENTSETEKDFITSQTLKSLKNTFWKRLLNNLIYIYKSKGTIRSIREFLKIYGVNPDWVRIKEAGYETDKPIEDYYQTKQKTKKALLFGSGSIYTGSQIVFDYSYLGYPFDISSQNYTFESHIKFPHYVNSISASYWSGSLTTASIARYENKGTATFDFYAIRENKTSNSGSLYYSSSYFCVSSSLLPLYNNEWWNIVFGHDNIKKVYFIKTGMLDADDVKYNNAYEATDNAFTSIANKFTIGALTSSDVPGEIITGSEYYLHECRLWSKVLTATEWANHIKNFESVGIDDYLSDNKKLISWWKLEDDINTDTNGSFVKIDDYSSPFKLATNYFSGSGSGFPPNAISSSIFIDHNIYYNQLIASSENDCGGDDYKIKIKPSGELPDWRTKPKNLPYLSVEFSLANILNENILSYFSTNIKFNEYVGMPINKWRQNYYKLDNISELYFRSLTGSIGFETYRNLFKWFDTNFIYLIKQLVPIKALYKGAEFVVESHMLERNKFQYAYLDLHKKKINVQGTMNLKPATVGAIEKIQCPQKITINSFSSERVKVLNKGTSRFSSPAAALAITCQNDSFLNRSPKLKFGTYTNAISETGSFALKIRLYSTSSGEEKDNSRFYGGINEWNNSQRKFLNEAWQKNVPPVEMIASQSHDGNYLYMTNSFDNRDIKSKVSYCNPWQYGNGWYCRMIGDLYNTSSGYPQHLFETKTLSLYESSSYRVEQSVSSSYTCSFYSPLAKEYQSGSNDFVGYNSEYKTFSASNIEPTPESIRKKWFSINSIKNNNLHIEPENEREVLSNQWHNYKNLLPYKTTEILLSGSKNMFSREGHTLPIALTSSWRAIGGTKVGSEWQRSYFQPKYVYRGASSPYNNIPGTASFVLAKDITQNTTSLLNYKTEEIMILSGGLNDVGAVIPGNSSYILISCGESTTNTPDWPLQEAVTSSFIEFDVYFPKTLKDEEIENPEYNGNTLSYLFASAYSSPYSYLMFEFKIAPNKNKDNLDYKNYLYYSAVNQKNVQEYKNSNKILFDSFKTNNSNIEWKWNTWHHIAMFVDCCDIDFDFYSMVRDTPDFPTTQPMKGVLKGKIFFDGIEQNLYIHTWYQQYFNPPNSPKNLVGFPYFFMNGLYKMPISSSIYTTDNIIYPPAYVKNMNWYRMIKDYHYEGKNNITYPVGYGGGIGQFPTLLNKTGTQLYKSFKTGEDEPNENWALQIKQGTVRKWLR